MPFSVVNKASDNHVILDHKNPILGSGVKITAVRMG
jgi:hypothetical protein